MVIRGNTRGNGKQLAQYLVSLSENEHIHILEVDHRTGNAATSEYLNDIVIGMDVMAKLTKAEKGLYHAQINPAYSEDKNMDWFKAADMLGEELGLADQRRVIVLHEKKGRTHAHVVWERYDHETGKVRSDSFSRLAQDRARRAMEIEFGHERTPKRNIHRPELKASLTQLWHQTGTGAQFIAACKNNNYMVAEGVGRHPFMVVDERGRTYDLVRQLNGIRLKDVRERLRNETLMKEKAAILFMRNKDTLLNRELDNADKPLRSQTAKIVHEFDGNKPDAIKAPDKTQNLGQEFAKNKADKTLSERQQIRQALEKERQARRDLDKDLDRDFGLDL